MKLIRILSIVLFRLGYWINSRHIDKKLKQYALAEYLSKYPNLPYESILRILVRDEELDNPEIEIRGPFQDYELELLSLLIREHYNSRLNDLKRGFV